MFLLTVNPDITDTRKLPEATLWSSFAEAVEAAFEAAAESELTLEMGEASIAFHDGTMFVPGFCEIIPITVSTRDRITWMGKERKNSEEENDD